MRSDARRCVPGIVFAVHAAVDDFGIHAGAGIGLADLVDDQDVDFTGMRPIQDLHEREQLFFLVAPSVPRERR